MKVLITGATGLIGKEIGKKLAEHGHEIFVVSRDVKKAQENLPFPCQIIAGDLNKGVLHDQRLLEIEGVINLMGESVFGERWTEEKKERIFSSRVVATRNLVQSLPASLKVFVSGSAIGYYGDCKEGLVSEDHPAGADFLAKVCVEWEAEANKAHGRKVIIRTSIVLSNQGGALEQMLLPFKAGLGGSLGDGRQWMSWIHINDIVGLFVQALENPAMQGPVNGCSPNPVTNRDFSKSLASSLGKSLGPSVPLVAIKTVFGEMAGVILASLRCSAERAQSLGYQFQFANIEEALNDLCAPLKDGEEVFYSEQFIPLPPEQVFKFFQDAHNLEDITPPTLNFKIRGMSTERVQQGTLIDYDLKVHGVPLKWKTEIDEWQPPHRFVDNQLKGPYSLWHHTHEFRPFCGGTLMVDRVRYRLPLGFVGRLLGGSFVKGDVAKIFKFRRQFVASKDWTR